ncbi:MAG: ABC transporter substrate-binding protein [Rhodothermales bacterium]|nr:ABC transporter substrate-binding protein [Rhodothermales bacterium]
MRTSTITTAIGITLALNTGTILAESVTLTTLEWPPYTSEALPQGGATTAVVKMALESVGLKAEVSTLPWKRAIADAKHNAQYVAYFPGYHCRHVDGFVASDPVGNGPLGFAENTQSPFTWENLDHIGEQKLTIGTVLGYSNTDEFDKKAGTGWIKVVQAKDDLTNLRKLLRKRIDAAVIDKLVLSYMLATESELADSAKFLKFDERALEDKLLYLCFVDDENGRALRDRFNKGLANLDIQKIVDRYFDEEF